jgi:hypothetical protein
MSCLRDFHLIPKRRRPLAAHRVSWLLRRCFAAALLCCSAALLQRCFAAALLEQSSASRAFGAAKCLTRISFCRARNGAKTALLRQYR